jgi:hypothetical protein
MDEGESVSADDDDLLLVADAAKEGLVQVKGRVASALEEKTAHLGELAAGLGLWMPVQAAAVIRGYINASVRAAANKRSSVSAHISSPLELWTMMFRICSPSSVPPGSRTVTTSRLIF